MISDFITAFAAALLARGYTAPVKLGTRYLSEQSDPTLGRVVFVLGTDPIGPTTRVGGNPRSRRTRLAQLHVHVWGAVVDTADVRDDLPSLLAAETLLHGTVNAAMDVAVGTTTFGSVEWRVASSDMYAGYLGIYDLTVEIPIVDTTAPTSPTDPPPDVVSSNTFTLGGTGASGPTCG